MDIFFPVWFFTAFGFEGRVTATKAIWREIALVSKNFHVKTNSSFGDTKTYGYFRLKEYNYYFEIILAQRSQWFLVNCTATYTKKLNATISYFKCNWHFKKDDIFT